MLKGSVSADLDTAASGSTVKVDSVKQNKESSTMTSMRNIASVAIVSWRQEDSTLSQRLGELRNSKGDQGIWARMSRGEFEYSGAYKKISIISSNWAMIKLLAAGIMVRQ